MLPTITVLRPKRSIMKPPSSPNTPPHSAAIQSIRPPHSRTASEVCSTFSSSATRLRADHREHEQFVGVEQEADGGDGEDEPAGDGRQAGGSAGSGGRHAAVSGGVASGGRDWA